jgi:hypothetical protein
MHVLQYIAVRAENSDEAMSEVDSKLTSWLSSWSGDIEAPSGVWYDWFVVGGGRFVEGDPYASSPNHIVSYAEDVEKFNELIEKAISNRVEEFNSYRKSLKEKDVDLETKLDSYTGEMQYDFELYPLKKMIDMLQGNWDCNSYFFDLEHDSTNTEHLRKKIAEGQEIDWFLVPVDFHF